MYLARVRIDGPDGPDLRIVATTDPTQRWIHVRTSERLRLERAGLGVEAARRIAAAVVPSSMTLAADGGPVFREAASRAAADTSGDAVAPESALFVLPVDPPAYRDFMVFEEHFSFGYRVARVAGP